MEQYNYLTDAVIDKAKTMCRPVEEAHHEHNDCIRIAYHWLDAQQKLKAPNKKLLVPMKHLIESWAKRYVSQSDVEVAAFIHPDLTGIYPFYNVSSRLTLPSLARLSNIQQAGIHQDYDRYNDADYKRFE